MERESEVPALPAPCMQVESLPALPPLARALLALSAGEADLDLLLSMLEREPELAARLLALARSTRPAPGEITTLRAAAAVLGQQALLSQAFSFCLVRALPRTEGQG